ncbi:MAG: hypothetical protein Q9160_007073 [Pyrenula sp. 1 TL-2023]
MDESGRYFTLTGLAGALAIFFTCLQQRTYGFAQSPSAIRAWLSNGVFYTNAEDRRVMQSSLVSYQLLQAPFELLCISITLFLGAIGVYLGSALNQNIPLSSPRIFEGNRGVLIAFVIGTFFALSLFGQLLGGRDVEQERWMRHMEASPSRTVPTTHRKDEEAGRTPTDEPLSGLICRGGKPSIEELVEALRSAAAAGEKLLERLKSEAPELTSLPH